MGSSKKPDVKAPRCRKNVVTTISAEMFNEFKVKYPKYKDLTFAEFRNVIKHHSEKIYETVIHTRDGVKLPENLGILVGSSCRKVGSDSPYKSYSTANGEKLEANLKTDGLLGKIFYTNYTEKGILKDRVLWSFTPIRQFKRSFSANFENNWMNYILVTKGDNVSKMFAKLSRPENDYSHLKPVFDMTDYNEFEI
jgi:hypothetical protein